MGKNRKGGKKKKKDRAAYEAKRAKQLEKTQREDAVGARIVPLLTRFLHEFCNHSRTCALFCLLPTTSGGLELCKGMQLMQWRYWAVCRP